MSGFEIAGVVLGSIPLVIATLENYLKGVRTIKRWGMYERELRSLIRNLETEKVKLQNVCEKLLDGLVSPSQIEEMVDNPLGILWTEEETQKKIRDRLWRSSSIFAQTVNEMKDAIDEIKEKLGEGATVC